MDNLASHAFLNSFVRAHYGAPLPSNVGCKANKDEPGELVGLVSPGTNLLIVIEPV